MKTIPEVIADLQEIRDAADAALTALRSGARNVPLVIGNSATDTVAQPAPPRAPVQRATDAGGRAIAAGLDLKEPFTREELGEKLDCTPQNAGNYLQRWKEKGWVKSPTRGLWQRTADFPTGLA